MLALFIEDEPENIAVVQMHLTAEIPDMTARVVGFDQANEAVSNLQPDIVVLDILRGGRVSQQVTEGLDVREFIWNHRFCPIIIFSAQPDFHDQKYEEHPFIKSVRKGSGSEELVLQAFRELLPIAESVRSTEDTIRRQLRAAMKETAGIAAKNVTDIDKLSDQHPPHTEPTPHDHHPRQYPAPPAGAQPGHRPILP